MTTSWFARGGSEGSLTPSAEFGVPRVAQGVPEEVEAQHCQTDGQAWKDREPGGLFINARPVLLSIKPHDGVGGWVPSPRKVKEASIRMAFPSQIEAMMSIGAVTLGRIWLAMMCRWRQPRACAASTYGFCFAESTAPRTMREWPGRSTTARASMALVGLGVNTETMAKARIRPGIAMRASMRRWSPRSSHPSQYPDTSPMIMPAKVPIPTASNPTHSEIRLP